MEDEGPCEGPEGEGPCAYELRRQRNIRRNWSFLASLGIGESDESSKERKLGRKRQKDNLSHSESEDEQHEQLPSKKAGMDSRFRTQSTTILTAHGCGLQQCLHNAVI